MFVGFNVSSWKAWTVAAAALVVTSVGIERTWSYLKTGHSLIGKKIEENIPIEFEIERVGQLIKEENATVREQEREYALMEERCEKLAKEIQAEEKDLAQAERDLFRLRETLENSSGSQVTIGEKTYAREEVDGEFKRRWDEYKARKKALEERLTNLKEYRSDVSQHREQIDQKRREIQKLELVRQNLEDQKRLLESQGKSGTFAFDKSKLEEARQLAEELAAKMRAERKANQRLLSQHRIELPPEEGSAVEQFDKLFKYKKQTVSKPQEGAATPVTAPGNTQ